MEKLKAKILSLEISMQDLTFIGIELLFVVSFFLLCFGLSNLIFRKIDSHPFIRKFKYEYLKMKQWIRGFLYTCLFLSITGLLVFNTFLLLEHTQISQYTQSKIYSIHPELLKQWFLALGKSFLLLILSLFAIRLIHQVLKYLCTKAKDYKNIRENDESIEIFFQTLHHIIRNSTFLSLILFTVYSLSLPAFIFSGFLILLKVYLIISLGLLLAEGISALIETFDAMGEKYAHKKGYHDSYQHLKNLIPLFRRCTEYVTYICVATLVTLQISFISPLAVYGERLAKLIGVFFLCRVLIEITNLIVDRILSLKKGSSDIEIQKMNTLSPLIKSLGKYLVFFIGIILALKSLNINPTTVLAGAGILGLVVGLGAQPLVNDVVTGFFILFENFYLVGDFIETSTAKGIVEAIDIRTSRIRSPNGQLHILRNGQLNEVINYSKQYIYAVVDVGVSYDTNLDHAYQVLKRAGEKLIKTNPQVLLPTEVLGLDQFGASELVIRTKTKVKPGCHIQVARDLRKIIKELFDEEKIEIPFPRQVVISKGVDPSLL